MLLHFAHRSDARVQRVEDFVDVAEAYVIYGKPVPKDLLDQLVNGEHRFFEAGEGWVTAGLWQIVKNLRMIIHFLNQVRHLVHTCGKRVIYEVILSVQARADFSSPEQLAPQSLVLLNTTEFLTCAQVREFRLCEDTVVHCGLVCVGLVVLRLLYVNSDLCIHNVFKFLGKRLIWHLHCHPCQGLHYLVDLTIAVVIFSQRQQLELGQICLIFQKPLHNIALHERIILKIAGL